MFEGAKCYSMVLNNQKIKFKVLGRTGSGLITGRLCGSNEKFEFNQYSLTNAEQITIEEIDCDDC